jgi:putative transport protein
MAWVSALWSGEGVAHDILILSLVAFCGLILGNVKVRGIGLGIAGVLFAGIAFAHYGVAILLKHCTSCATSA